MLDLRSLDLEEIGNALADQTGYEHRWLINPRTGQIAFWTADTGIDGQTPVDLDDPDLVGIDPLPSTPAQPKSSTRSVPEPSLRRAAPIGDPIS